MATEQPANFAKTGALRPARVVILGSGTSTGVPVIGCDCAVCTGGEPLNQRTRASIMLEVDGLRLVVDTGPDFRTQMLRAGVHQLSAVLYTHLHADHVHGFDDLRAFSFDGAPPVPCYLHRRYLEEFRQRFAYAFVDTGYQGAKPAVDLHGFDDGPVELEVAAGRLTLEAVSLPHGPFKTSGFRLGRFAYVTDFKEMPEEIVRRWQGQIDVMVASGIHFKPHRSHSNIPETIALMQRLGVKRGIVTHLAHEVDGRRDADRLPAGVVFAYDGMAVDVEL